MITRSFSADFGRPCARRFVWSAARLCFAILVGLLSAPPTAGAQQMLGWSNGMPSSADSAAVTVARTPAKKNPDGELAVMGMIPDGDYRLFSATVRCHAWTIGVEYDRRWGHVGKIRLDYVTEILPITVLSQPAEADYWGNALTQQQEFVPGLSISPFGLRFLFREGKKIRPIVVGKLGAIAFSQKAMSQKASYVNFNVQAAAGVQYALNNRFDLRVEPFEFFHVSNGYLASSNPGMDQIGWRVGFSYHLRKKGW